MRTKDQYREFIEETSKVTRGQDQSAVATGVVREMESHISDLMEEEKRAMNTDPLGNMVHNALTEAMTGVSVETLESMESPSMEEKLIASREEEYPPTRELTPGEISLIVSKALRGLPESLSEQEEVSDSMFDVAYAVMTQLAGE